MWSSQYPSFFARSTSLLVTATIISLLTTEASAQDLEVVITSPQKYKFALIGKSIDNVFFKEVNLGCSAKAQDVSSNRIQSYQNVQVEWCVMRLENLYY